jgi:hypothetical protein
MMPGGATATWRLWRGRLAAFALAPGGVWLVWGLTRLLLLLNVVIGHHFSDPQFYQYAGDFAVGRLPYRDVPVEYPPLALGILLLPALPLLPFSGIAPRPDANPHPLHPDPARYMAYGISFAVMMLAVDALTLWLVQRAARRMAPGDANGMWSGLIYVVLTFASTAILQKFDLVVGSLCLAAVLALFAQRDGLAWGMLAAATLVKGFPIVIVPLFVLWRVRGTQIDWPAIRRGIAGGAAVSLAVLGPIALASGIAPLAHSVTYHTGRGLEIESLWASLALAVGWLPGQSVHTTFDPADLSRDVQAPLVNVVGTVGPPLLLLGLLVVIAICWRRARRGAFDQALLLQGAGAMLLIFLLAFRAFPLHYILALIPLIAVTRLPGRAQGMELAALALACLAGQVVITTWPSLVHVQPLGVIALLVRNLALVVAGALLMRAIIRDHAKV